MARVSCRARLLACAAVLPLLLTGCGQHGSVVAPVELPTASAQALQPAAITPGTAHAGGPALTVYTTDFRYTSPAGTYLTDPQTWVQLEVQAGEPRTVQWFGRARGGARILSYRWALDIADVFDETPRLDEATDLAHWSRSSPSTVSATLPAFAAGEEHLLYVEATDTNGFRSLLVLQLEVVEFLPRHAGPR